MCWKAAEPDDAKRGRMLSEAEALIDAEAPIVPLFHFVNAALVRDGTIGVTANQRNLVVFKSVRVERKK